MSTEKQVIPFVPKNDRGNLLTAVALIVVMAVGAVMAVMAWRAEPAESAQATVEPGPSQSAVMAFLKGDTTAAIGRKLEQQLPLRTQFIQLANSLRYLVFRGGGDEVKVGSSDWLYLTEEYHASPDDAANLRTRVHLLGQAQQQLQAQGVQMLVVLVPDKSRIESQHLPWLFGTNPHSTRYADALKSLSALGVPTVDLRNALTAVRGNADAFYRTDTHWNQQGAKAAASELAKHVAALGSCSAPSQFATAQAAQSSERPGDLLRMMGLDTASNRLRPRPDRERVETTSAVASPNSGMGGALFGDTAVDYVLAGTSFSLRGNFHGALQQALGCTVLNVAQDGAGFLDSMRSYLQDPAFAQSKPKVLIWEIPERFLSLPLGKESTWLTETGLKPE